MTQLLYQVDAFTNTPFSGNAAAVCVLPAPQPADWMQQVAREMNLSETAFLVPRPDGFDLRWFTPAVEVDLCGHATLASAHILWETGMVAPEATARFHTLSGWLSAWRDGAWIRMDFPAEPPRPLPEHAAVRRALLEALGAEATFVGKNRMDYLVALRDADAVRNLAPEMGALAAIEARGIIVTAPSDTPSYDFVSRFFAPRAGIAEDPVTGSAHCALAPYWAERMGKETLVGFQASDRGGVVQMHSQGERVHLGGQAVTVLRAELLDGG